MRSIIITVVFAATFSTNIASAGIIALDWASVLDTSSNVTNPSGALGAPDDSYATFGPPATAAATYSSFGAGSTTNTDDMSLAGLLSINESVLSQAEFITFEGNGPTPDPFETTTWTFDDGNSSIQVSHDYFIPVTGGGIVAFGNVSTNDYGNFFGVSVDPGAGSIAFLLFDLNGLNLTTPNFGVTIDAPGIDSGVVGTPDIDVLGTITSVPEPTAVWLILCGIVSCAGFTMFRKNHPSDRPLTKQIT